MTPTETRLVPVDGPSSDGHVLGDPTPDCPRCGENLGVAGHFVCDHCDWEEGEEMPAFVLKELATEADAFTSAEDVADLIAFQPATSVTGADWTYTPEFFGGAWRMRCNDAAGFVGFVGNAHRLPARSALPPREEAPEGAGRQLYEAFCKRNGGGEPAWCDQSSAIRNMWDAIADDAAALRAQPQPKQGEASGETREAVARVQNELDLGGPHARIAAVEVRDLRAILALIRPAPVAGEAWPTNEEIRSAIRATEYKYFGDYEFTEAQHDAVDVLVRAAQALLSARPPARPEALDEGAAGEFETVEAMAEAWSDRVEIQRMVETTSAVFAKWANPELLSRFRQQMMGVIQQAYIEGVSARVEAIARAHPSPTPAADDDRLREVLKLGWGCAMTVACNIAIDEQNRANDDDAASEILNAQGEIIRRIKGVLDIDDGYMAEALAALKAEVKP